MNDLLFYTLIIALLYYFFIYLPSQKSSNPPPQPFTQNQTTQTESQTSEPNTRNCPGPKPKLEPELESTLDTLIKDIQTLNKQIQ